MLLLRFRHEGESGRASTDWGRRVTLLCKSEIKMVYVYVNLIHLVTPPIGNLFKCFVHLPSHVLLYVPGRNILSVLTGSDTIMMMLLLPMMILTG